MSATDNSAAVNRKADADLARTTVRPPCPARLPWIAAATRLATAAAPHPVIPAKASHQCGCGTRSPSLDVTAGTAPPGRSQQGVHRARGTPGTNAPAMGRSVAECDRIGTLGDPEPNRPLISEVAP